MFQGKMIHAFWGLYHCLDFATFVFATVAVFGTWIYALFYLHTV